MAGSESSVVRTILYLRPQTPETIDVLDIIENEPYRFEVAPPPEPIDIPLGKIPDLFLTTHLSPYGSTLPDHGRVTRESTPGPYSISPRVLRLGFDSIETPSAQGFELGYGPTSDIKVPYLSTDPSRNLRRAYLRIHYNFNSGALLITALDKIKVGSARLSPRQSVLLMAGTTIHCGGEYEFAVEYPDLSNCAEEHERNYQEYAAKLGVLGAQYMASSRAEDPPIGAEHRSKAILGRGAFGEVHLAWNTKTGAAFAIKKLIGKRVDAMKEVNIMSRLSHANIIKYEGAFSLPSGETCIVMELAVNDLYTHRKARQRGKRGSYLSLPCIRSIGRQTLSGLEYLHNEGFMHRDLKPQNMLVTKWDAVTDTPTIKLADFGLAGIDLEGETYCGSPGYIAPEVVEAEKVRKIQKKMGIKTVKLKYTNAVDIWALGKILWDLVRDLPPRISLLRGKTAEVNTEPALRLIDRMMLDNPHKRPTASESLDDPWMATIGSSEGSLAQKRGRSPALSMSSPTSSVDERLLKAVRRAMAGSTDEGSTAIMMNALWSHERSQQNSSAQALCGASGSSGIEKDSSLVKAGSIKDDPREDNDDPQEVSPSMQDVVSRVLAELKAEGYAHCVTTGGKELSQLNISSAQIQQESEGSTTRLEFESFWDKVDRSIGLQSAGPVDQNITAGSEDASR